MEGQGRVRFCPCYEIDPLSGGFFITREGIKRGREKEKRRESARKEEGRECVRKGRGKEKKGGGEGGYEPNRPWSDGARVFITVPI